MREVAWDANQDGHFVAFPGLEWTKNWGHINIYHPKTRHWPDDPTKFTRHVPTPELWRSLARLGNRQARPAQRENDRMGKLARYLTVTEATEYLGVAANTLRNWDRDERICG